MLAGWHREALIVELREQTWRLIEGGGADGEQLRRAYQRRLIQIQVRRPLVAGRRRVHMFL